MFFVDKKLSADTRGTFADFYCNKNIADAALLSCCNVGLTHTDTYTVGVLSGQCRSLSPGEELPDWTVAHAKVDPSSSTNQVFRAIEIFSFSTVADLVVQ